MRGEDRGRAVRDLAELLDEAHAAGLEVPDDVTVVDDLAAHVDGPVEAVESQVHDLDGPHDARAEAPGRGEQDALQVGGESFRSHVSGVAVEAGLVRDGLHRPLRKLPEAGSQLGQRLAAGRFRSRPPREDRARDGERDERDPHGPALHPRTSISADGHAL